MESVVVADDGFFQSRPYTAVILTTVRRCSYSNSP